MAAILNFCSYFKMLKGDKVASVSSSLYTICLTQKHTKTFVIPYIRVPGLGCPTIN